MSNKQSTAIGAFTPPAGGSFSMYFKASPELRPLPNIGCLFDIFTGRYHFGKHGEAILNGGLGHCVGVGGQGNSFKSVLLHFFTLVVLNRYRKAMAQIYDTEGSVQQARLEQLAQHLKHIAGLDLVEIGRLFFTDSPTMKLDVWYEALSQYMANKISKENRKSWTFETPFWSEEDNAYVKALAITVGEIDSLSMAKTSVIQGVMDDNSIGSSELNTVSLRTSRDKSQLLVDLADATIDTNTFVTMTAHVGPQHQLDPRSPPAKQLMFLKQKLSFKDVPQKFTFTTNILWFITSTEVLKNDTTKAPEFPRSKDDDLKGDTDLQKLSIMAVRNKYGPSGIPFEIILSQDEGVMVGLTEFNYIRSFNRFGLGGNVQNYFLELYPSVNLSRTTIRGKIDEDEKLQRALTITSELCQMINHWEDPERLFCSPKELYEDIKALGYDWDVLLNTRGYWVYREDEDGELPFLSTLDLLRMRKGLYHPYWMEPLKKAA